MSDITFMNVDLEVESPNPLDVLIEDLGEDVLVLHNSQARGLHTAAFEVSYGGGDAESSLSLFCTLIENLSPKAKAVWDACISRTFDLGYGSGDTPRNFRSIIHPDTVARIAKLNAVLVVTIYPVWEKDQDPSSPDN
ncbi:MAG: hypothetical protein ACIAXF_15175 [Phycisphaerales bacterium JB063]